MNECMRKSAMKTQSYHEFAKGAVPPGVTWKVNLMKYISLLSVRQMCALGGSSWRELTNMQKKA